MPMEIIVFHVQKVLHTHTHIYRRYTSPRLMDPLVHHPDQPVGHRPSQGAWPTDPHARPLCPTFIPRIDRCPTLR
jgi:hypothetical protein